MEDRTSRRPETVILVAALYLAFSWLSFLLIDVLNLADLQNLLARRMSVPITWYLLFQEGGATEILQWLFLGLAALVGAFLAGLAFRDGKATVLRFWGLMGIACTLLLMEDAGNARHYLAALAGLFVPSSLRPTITILVEVAYYSLLASVPLYALWRYRRPAFSLAPARRFLLLGFASYAVASAASVTRDVGDWYRVLGGAIRGLLGDQLLIPPGWDLYVMEFYLVDWLLEESVELVGAAALAAAAVASLRHYLRQPGPAG